MPYPDCHPTVELHIKCPGCGNESHRYGGSIEDTLEDLVYGWNENNTKDNQ
jgi:hypothetical protein